MIYLKKQKVKVGVQISEDSKKRLVVYKDK